MQLIYAETVAIVLGLAVHAVLPRRGLTGVLLLPAVAGVACAIVWVGLTWARVQQGGAGDVARDRCSRRCSPRWSSASIVRTTRYRRDEDRLAAADGASTGTGRSPCGRPPDRSQLCSGGAASCGGAVGSAATSAEAVGAATR